MAVVLFLFLFCGDSCGRERAAVVTERRRIARELHDTVGNRLLVMALHARRLSAADTSAPASGEVIDDLARLTMNDLRRMLGRLTDVPDGAWQPLPGQARERPAESGSAQSLVRAVEGIARLMPPGRVAVSCHDGGAERALAPAVRQAALSIAQECITNGVKHGTGVVRVRIGFATGVRITVVNRVAGPGRALSSVFGSSRLGLRGVRERAVAVGGTVTHGPAPAGGFQVSVWLPAPFRPAGRPVRNEPRDVAACASPPS
ncbi:sensor histidine kinase [Streptomyces aidingensis]|uniref:sensor histidine kinase n=1 Tax=Streptomyces aidingensis TaxID=910347 RepID=UPI00158728EA|nr:histidine kinase [Streptomyces aidingensis]